MERAARERSLARSAGREARRRRPGVEEVRVEENGDEDEGDEGDDEGDDEGEQHLPASSSLVAPPSQHAASLLCGEGVLDAVVIQSTLDVAERGKEK